MNETLLAQLGLTAEEVELHNGELRELVFAWMRSREVRTHELLAITLPVLLATVLCMAARSQSGVPSLIRQYVSHLQDVLSKISTELEASPAFQREISVDPEQVRPN